MTVRLHKGVAIKRDRQHERAVRSAQVLESFASGFTLRPVSVKLVQGAPAPAFSSSNRIWFDESQLADLTTAIGVTSLKGLTIHEIAHILLTPRSGSDLMEWLMETDFKRSWNALEDQRIESALLVTYPSIKPWLEATMDEYLLKTPEQWALSFPLIHGRKYLDAKVRLLVREVFVNQQDVAELSSIIDQYRTLNMAEEADVETAKVLIERYHELTKDLRLPNPNGHNGRSINEHETNVKSRPWSKDKQKEASDKVGEESEDDEDFDWSDLFDDEDEPDEDDSDGGEGDSDEGDSDDEDEGDSEDGDSTSSDQSSDSDSGSKGDLKDDSTGGGKGGSTGSPEAKALQKLLEQNLEETLESLADKIANDIDLYNGDVLLEGEAVPEPERYEHERILPVSAKSAEGADAFGFSLQQLRAEQAPAWARRTTSGRINPARWEAGCAIEEAFDRWEEGHEDATDIECVVLLDVSGSMSDMDVKAHESMWAIKSALDSIQASTSVIAYSDGSYDSRILYSAHEQVGSDMRFIGSLYGTDPYKSLQYARFLLANSSRAIKLLIVITDGQWFGKVEESEETINDIRNGGVITTLAYLSSYSQTEVNAHGCEIVCHVTDPADLFDLGQAIVEVGINRQLTH